jgi:hypothetical protein
VTRYVAERVVERQRMMEGGVQPAAALKRPVVTEAEPPLELVSAKRRRTLSAVLSGLAMVAGGALVGLAVSVILLWDRIVAMKFSF